MPDDPRPGAEDLPGLEGLDLSSVEYEKWSDSDWAGWFRDEVMVTERWSSLELSFDSFEGDFRSWNLADESGESRTVFPAEEFARDPRSGSVEPSLESTVRMLAGMVGPHPAAPLVIGQESWDHAFGRLSTESKLHFIETWYQVFGPGEPQEPEESPDVEPEESSLAGDFDPNQTDRITDADWDVDPAVNITLPGGRVVATPVSRNAKRWIMGAAGGLLVGLGAVAVVTLGGGDPVPAGVEGSAVASVPSDEDISGAGDETPDQVSEDDVNDSNGEAAPSAVPEPLELVHPCDVVSADVYSTVVGHPAEAGSSGNDRRLICVMTPPDGLGSPNMGMWLEVQRGDSGFFENWQSRHAEATVVPLSSPIADLSEARVGEHSIGCTTEVRTGPAVTLQAHLTGDPLGRDVFVLVEAQPVLTCDGPDVPDQGFQLGVVENLARQLVDALLAQSG